MKRQIFIGDVQGCCTALERLLDKLRFDPAGDQLRFAGDLVNRGGESLQTLRLVCSLGESAMTVLGNHDLHLLAYAAGTPRGGYRNRNRKREFEAILEASDGDGLLAWLRRQPLFWESESQRLALVHAGIDPRWNLASARARAREVEAALADRPHAFFTRMYGDHPRRWDPDQDVDDQLRVITNVMTRMRFCDQEGRLDLDYKGELDKAPKGFRPWFEFLHPDWSGWTIVFGHWSLLGLYRDERVICLDTGCVWGGELTALVVEGDERRLVAVSC